MSLKKTEPGAPSDDLRALLASLRIPVMAAPMFLVSGPALLTACCSAGVIGSLPAPNARTIEQLGDWLSQIAIWFEFARSRGERPAPWLFNMIVHSSYDRFTAELALLRRFKPPLVSTALGSPRKVLDEVHAYGGFVLADVVTPAQARKAIGAGVDGLVLVCNGAGGHTGSGNPFAFIAEVREFWEGPLGLAGAIGNGRDLHAARVLGADFCVVGTRFIATRESLVEDDYRQMLTRCSMDDLVPTRAVSGVLANWMRPSLERAGIDPEAGRPPSIDFSGNIASANKAWKDVWSAGHGVAQVKKTCDASELVEEIERGYLASLNTQSPCGAYRP